MVPASYVEKALQAGFLGIAQSESHNPFSQAFPDIFSMLRFQAGSNAFSQERLRLRAEAQFFRTSREFSSFQTWSFGAVQVLPAPSTDSTFRSIGLDSIVNTFHRNGYQRHRSTHCPFEKIEDTPAISDAATTHKGAFFKASPCAKCLSSQTSAFCDPPVLCMISQPSAVDDARSKQAESEPGLSFSSGLVLVRFVPWDASSCPPHHSVPFVSADCDDFVARRLARTQKVGL